MRGQRAETVFRRYVWTVLACAAPFVTVAALCAWLLFAAGEFTSVRDIAVLLQQREAIYGSGVHDVRQQLKLEIIRVRRPEIVALGSSRALDFRQEFFTAPFACGCQALTTLEQGDAFLEAMAAIHRPRLVLFLIDFWWLLQPSDGPFFLRLDGEPRMTARKLLKPLELIWNGDVRIGETVPLLWPATPSGPGPERLGLLAKVRGIGIRADGSMLHGVRLDDYGFEYYREFADAFADPESYVARNARYRPGQTIQAERIAFFKGMIERLRARGSTVIAILPPIAPPIYQALDLADGHRHIAELRRRLAGAGDEFYDLHDPGLIGADKCEFADIHHGGNTAYMRLLRHIATTNPRSRLRDYVDLASLSAAIAVNTGRTIARFDATAGIPAERDFLGLGCDKSGS